MFLGEEIHRAIVRHMTGLRNRDIEELVEGQRFPPPVRENYWAKRDVEAWVKGTTIRLIR